MPAMAGICATGSSQPETRLAGGTPSQALQQRLKDLERAYANFFAKRADFPRFKKKGRGDRFRYPQGFKLEQANVQYLLAQARLAALSQQPGRSGDGEERHRQPVAAVNGSCRFRLEREVEQPPPVATSAIGIDVGIARFATLSDASYIAPLNSFKKHQQRLARYQRRMSRKVKFSNNWKKAKARVQKIHIGIANARNDFLHKTTTTISQNHALVCIEDLQVRNMSRSARGTSQEHGKKVKQKSGLNRSMLDQGWGEFRRQLHYKVSWKGGLLLAVAAPPHQSNLPELSLMWRKTNRLTQALFLCVDCGYENNADVVGAINILERGHRLLACGESAQSGRSTKQEPTEATQAALACAP